jgi:hypothetical protein
MEEGVLKILFELAKEIRIAAVFLLLQYFQVKNSRESNCKTRAVAHYHT